MAYPPDLPPTNRTNATLSQDNHPTDHNKLAAAIRDVLAELGAGPAGAFATLTDRMFALTIDGLSPEDVEEFNELVATVSAAATAAGASALSASASAELAAAIAVGDLDAALAVLLAAGASASSAAVAGIADYRADPLHRWHQSLRAGTGKLSFVGDSTSLRANTGIHGFVYDEFGQHPGSLLANLNMSAQTDVLGGGNNGNTLVGFLNMRTDGTGVVRDGSTYSWAAVVADAPTLLVFSMGINDVRGGACDLPTLIARLRAVVEALQVDLPNMDILLRMPNVLAGTPNGYLTPSTTAAAQTYSTMLRTAYLELVGDYNHVAVADVQANVFGTTAFDVHPFLADQLHPNGQGVRALVTYLMREFVALPESRYADEDWRVPTTHVGPVQLNPTNAMYVRSIRVQGGGNGYLDVSRPLDVLDGVQGGQLAIFPDDVLYLAGRAAPFPLTGANITSQTLGVARIYLSGDHSDLAGLSGVVIGYHGGEGIAEGRVSSGIIDPPSIAAGGTYTVTGLSCPGARQGMGVLASPANGQDTLLAGLLWNAYVTGVDTVAVRLFNATGAPIDTAFYFNFWLAR